ncbi:LOW QUALITY PROTEIN: arylacetamide deacetylase-like 2 [Ursus americanus]|uniref:LOW QUALITY PROTEIN: arylacetamide deacetylase-like 2 n=1 Tax=Ursus maritimus TaxID=29073 RepID=A0A384DE61_URSMA|nr:LOW QUALITY PROTEIN: arylacetamide deacetylase-like 2 [Ursus maritimus]XP_026353080.1 LOW QUALITY PROTEIN: arylacetamide deacetylase-like 2 [Ursus arctos]XP_045668480.1 LOW QUALITY PROTEIN: arylacetamide deacetylase-like 2 [Ursus americanus]
MGFKALCLGLFCAFFASRMYVPIPGDIEEYWKVTALDIFAKTCTFMAVCFESIGTMKYEEVISMLLRLDYTQPVSDEYVTVMDTTFVHVPVRLYLPKRKSETPRRAVIYLHGGAFCFGSFKNTAWDSLNRWTAKKLNAVVVGVDYRLAPQHHFPVAYEDSFTAVKFFLQDEILAKYGVDPTRICISGDSAGGNLAAAVAQQVQNDPEFKHKIKTQALLYPALQVIDCHLPSHQENEHGVVITKDLAIKFVSLYFTNDEILYQAMRRNEHMPLESRHLFKLVNWSTFLPEKFRKDYVYTEPILGRYNYSWPVLTDIRASPLLANDSWLQNLPPTYVLTCQYDIVRDDGVMYVSRLQNVGVQVTHDHIENGIHGALSYTEFPLYLRLGFRIRDMYISWLDKNL